MGSSAGCRVTYLRPENADFLFQVLGEWQLELPLPMPADIHHFRATTDRNVRELTAEMVEDIVEGPTEYNLGYNILGEAICGIPIEKRPIRWWRFTLVPSLKGETLHVEGWFDRPQIEGVFNPKQGRAA